MAVGIAAILLSLAVDVLGIGEPGFGPRQLILLVLGSSILLTVFATRLLARVVGQPPIEAERHSFGARWKTIYVTTAILAFNTLVLFLFVSLVLWLGFLVSDATGWTTAERSTDLPGASPILRLARMSATWAQIRHNSPLELGDSDLQQIYPGWDREDIATLIKETRGRRLGYLPFAQFRERRHEGRFVNVSEHGFRISLDLGPWPMSPESYNLWVFGGSTTFGYGVADTETVTSHLQQFLAQEIVDRSVAVYNFGQGYYYSSQELALFYRLLMSEDVYPDMVVFIDGINEHFEEPYYSQSLRELMQSPQAFLRPDVAILDQARAVTERYFKNRALIIALSRSVGIRTLFVWQPNPAWNYDLRFHLFLEADPKSQAPVLGHSAYYAHMESHSRSSGALETIDFLYLADLQLGLERALYVDRIHYTAEFSKTLAERIGDRILEMKGAAVK